MQIGDNMGICGIYVRTSVDKENTSIEQQINIGKEFCKKNNFKYQVYEDVGITGFGVDKNNPFKYLSGLKNLLDDIEKKIIDKVWVWEHSRSSRDKFLSYHMNDIIKKHNVIIYEKGLEIDLNIPEIEFFQDIKTGFSILERHKIVDRITRGVHDSINRGIHGMRMLYGYKKEGKTIDDYVNWVPVKSEIENLKYLFEKYLEGKSVKSIISDIHNNKKFSGRQEDLLYKKWYRLLKQFIYTGNLFNIEGRKLYKQFENFEIDSLKELNNKKYYNKSVQFPIQIVSVKNWISINEHFQKYRFAQKDKMRRTNTEFLTGVIECPYCELKYFVYIGGKYHYYKHYHNTNCGQRPKSLNVKNINNIFEIFFFYFYLVYDDTKNLIEESQRLIKINQMEIKEKIKSLEIENRKLDKQIEKFQAVYEETNDKELLKLTLIKEKELNAKKLKNDNILNQLNCEIEELNKEYDKDKLELTYYDVKERIINFIEIMSIEEKRKSIIQIIKSSKLFGKYIIINTGKLLFIFNIEEEYILSENIYNKFKKDKNFKDNFLNSTSTIDNEGNIKILDDYIKYYETEYLKNKNISDKQKKAMIKKDLMKMLNNISDYLFVRKLDKINIQEIYLKDKKHIDIKIIFEKKLSVLGIDYDLSGIDKIVSFTLL